MTFYAHMLRQAMPVFASRPLFVDLSGGLRFNLFHVRYNAVQRGAETDVFSRLPDTNRPGIVTCSATRWGDLLKSNRMPPGQAPMNGTDCYRFVLSNPNLQTMPSKNQARKQAWI
jgi:hypothetical protein